MGKVTVRLLLVLALLAVVAAPASAKQPPNMPKPGPEHMVLKDFIGTWDANIEMAGMPASKGSSVYKAGPGEFWVTSEFKGDFGGMPFAGHGISGYDPNKKKYI